MFKTRFPLLLALAMILLVACDRDTSESLATLVPTALAPEPTDTATAPPPTETPVPPTPAPTATASPTATPAPTVTPVSADLSISDDQISFFPVPALYAGDLVSVRVEPTLPDRLAPNEVRVTVLVDGREASTGVLNWQNLNGDTFGLFPWIWDTTAEEGAHTVTVRLDPEDRIRQGDEDPDNNQASVSVTVLPRQLLPPHEAGATWMSAEISCCTVNAVSGTAAARDLDQLLPQVEQAFLDASAALGLAIDRRYDVYLVDRVIGQGGYASDTMVVSYLDRDYSGGGLREVLVHEAVHMLDRAIAPDRVPFLSEGVAVWASGGHYHPENLDQRARALLEIGRYMPLTSLIDNFYAQQHETGYLQAASLISYLVEIHGWPAVRDFYADVSYDDGPTLVEAVDANLLTHFGKSLATIEAEWLTFLERQPRDRDEIAQLEMDLRFYEVMRRYQEAFDPTAYYLYAWLPSPNEARKRGATADLTRHPEEPANLALETMLEAAASALVAEDLDRASALIDGVQRVLDNDGQFLDPLSRSYLGIVEASAANGYEVQQVDLEGDRASVLAFEGSSGRYFRLNMRLQQDQTWAFTQ